MFKVHDCRHLSIIHKSSLTYANFTVFPPRTKVPKSEKWQGNGWAAAPIRAAWMALKTPIPYSKPACKQIFQFQDARRGKRGDPLPLWPP